jgi:aminomethyltransferase
MISAPMSTTATEKAPPGPPRRTPLYERHVALGARVIDFGGCITNDVGRLANDGQALYSVACRPSGGIVDDLIVYRMTSEAFMIVVNAANIDKDFGWFVDEAGPLCAIRNNSDETALVAVQGPRAVELVASLADKPVAQLPSFHFGLAKVTDVPCSVARTGYTGEDGFELFCHADAAGALWDRLLEAGRQVGCRPIGLGARDTLRLEARLCLYGNDIDEEHTPHEAGLSWVVRGRGFIGEEALARQKAEGVQRKLVGFVMKERGIARHGYPILDPAGAPIGVVTSGTTGPTVGANIGLGYVPTARAEPGGSLTIDCRGKPLRAEIVKGPFYKRPS